MPLTSHPIVHAHECPASLSHSPLTCMFTLLNSTTAEGGAHHQQHQGQQRPRNPQHGGGQGQNQIQNQMPNQNQNQGQGCLLYTSDAADD